MAARSLTEWLLQKPAQRHNSRQKRGEQMKNIGLFITVIGLVLSLKLPAQSADYAAQAVLQGTDGKNVGTVWFTPAESGVKIKAEITGLAHGVRDAVL
ncbi:MAG: hypothetical protein GVY02_00115 [Bacteroidetes bacterium]|jgi:Cu/Zn superoxide dismutase|nr:hypothetical protein [Bacteroidota bacterium]